MFLNIKINYLSSLRGKEYRETVILMTLVRRISQIVNIIKLNPVLSRWAELYS